MGETEVKKKIMDAVIDMLSAKRLVADPDDAEEYAEYVVEVLDEDDFFADL